MAKAEVGLQEGLAASEAAAKAAWAAKVVAGCNHRKAWVEEAVSENK